MTRDGVEHGAKHRRRQPPGVRVVAAAVIAVDQHAPAWQPVRGAVRERDTPAGLQPERAQRGVVRDAAERQDDAAVGHRAQIRREVAVAFRTSAGVRLVLRAAGTSPRW